MVLIAVSIAAIAVGIFGKRNEVYLLGVVLLLFVGLWSLQEGISEPAGSVLNDSGTTTVVTTTFETTTTVWTNGFGLLLVVIAGGLALAWNSNRKKARQEQLESVEDEE